VERRDVRGEVAFRTREALLGYRARVANAVFVAEKA
jgi:hypothetical protein